MSPALAGGFLTTVPPGKSHDSLLSSEIIIGSSVCVCIYVYEYIKYLILIMPFM